MVKLLISPHGRKLSLARPIIMGILNVTPDSFYDGGRFFRKSAALKQAEYLIVNGCEALDIGGESTGPGSCDISCKEELKRILPVIFAIRSSRNRKLKNIWISIDTYKAEVARQAIEAGADMINDVTAFRCDSEMIHVVAQFQAPIILMYAKDATPRTTRTKTHYKDVMRIVGGFLQERTHFAIRHGVERSKIIIDPGMGAFVSGMPKYSFEILRRLTELTKFGYPICVGPSMKSFLGGKTMEDRRIPSIFAAWFTLQNGASIVRVHEPLPLGFIMNRDHPG